MKKLISILVVLAVAAAANASIATLDNFESYADSAALNAAWVVHTGGTVLTETLEVSGDNQFMKLYTTGGGAGWAQTKYTLPGAVWQEHGVNWTYLGYTDISFSYKITNQASDKTQLTIYNCWGEKIAGADVGNGLTHDWETVTLNLEAIKVAGKNFENVAIVGFTIKNTYYGAGDLLIDDVILTPEPATMVLLGLGGLLLRKRS